MTILIVFLLAGDLFAAKRLIAVDSTVEFDPYSTAIGSQGFNASYQLYPNEAMVVQQARYTMNLGSDVYKFSLAPTGDVQTVDPPDVDSLVTRIQNVPAFQQVLDMPFECIMMWVYPVGVVFNLNGGYTSYAAEIEYQELYDLTRYLMQRYEGTGRTFMIGHWEGDWTLLEGYDSNANPRPEMIVAMRAWINNRQNAIQAARQSLPAVQGVNVYHYAEVNLVRKSMLDPTKATYTSSVLPYVTVDAVSYSAYEATNFISQMPQRLYDSLDYIESKANFSGVFHHEKAVFLGEFGVGELEAAQAASAWGCPYIMYWSVYKNVDTHTFFLVDSDGSYNSSWYLFNEMLAKATAQRDVTRMLLNHNPDSSQFSDIISGYASNNLSDIISAGLSHVDHTSQVDNASFLMMMFQQLLLTNDYQSSLFFSLLSDLDAGTKNRWQTLLCLMDTPESKNAFTDSEFANWIYEKILLRENDEIGIGELSGLENRLAAGESRSAIYHEFLNSQQSLNKALETRFSDFREHKLSVLTVENFESYNTDADLAGSVDGYGGVASPNGSLSLETNPFHVHQGQKSLRADYDLSPGVHGFIDLNFSPQDWSAGDILTFWYKGSPGNSKEFLWVKTIDNDRQEVNHFYLGQFSATDQNQWTKIAVDLRKDARFSTYFTNIAQVQLIIQWGSGGSGTVYFDDIRLVAEKNLATLQYENTVSDAIYYRYMADFRNCPDAAPGDFNADLNSDCFIDYADLSVISGNWLSSGSVVGDLNGDSTVTFSDFAHFAALWLE